MKIVCFICEIQFSTKSSLIRHQKNKHKLNNEIDVSSMKLNSKCSLCKKAFPKKTLLIDHLNNCHGMSIVKEIIEFLNVSGKLEFSNYFNIEK